MKNIFTLIAAMILGSCVFSQDLNYARKVINDLAGEAMHGRGYVKDGDLEAARYINREFETNKLSAFKGAYMQEYSFGINTFPYKLTVIVDGNELKPGTEFLVSCASPSLKGTYELIWLLNDSVFDPEKDIRFEGLSVSDKFIVTDKYHKNLKKDNYFGSKGVIFLKDDDANLWWHVSNGHDVLDFVALDIRRSKLPPGTEHISLDIKNKYIEDHKTNNIAAYVQGIVQPDTFIVFTAHYDHLGMMGQQAYFPGANDNASGTAMVLDLARHYAHSNPQPWYSMVFITLSGEETSLNGSKYFAENPLFPLENVKALINLDMVGTGSDGITLVNGKVFMDDYERLVKLNKKGAYLKKVKIRGESCNSDHCPFYKAGVKAFFIYTMGKEHQEYHTVDDKPEVLPLTEYNDVFKLLLDFAASYEPGFTIE